MDDETVDICTGLFLVGGVADGPDGCNRQALSPKAVKELPQVHDTAVVGWPKARSTRPRELRQCWERQAIGQPRPVRKGRRKPEIWNSWTWRMSSSLHTPIQLVRLMNYICE